jgi:hypothetical protein
MARAPVRVASVSSALAALLCAASASAGDPFEIQVYDGTANAPWVPGVELHLNDWATGNRNDYVAPEAPLHGQIHATLEPSIGITPFWELGAYLLTAWRTDQGVFEWAGGKLRSKFVTPETFSPNWRLGVNLEVSCLSPTYDHDQWGTEIRPIVAWHDARWLFVLNPILDQPLAGSDAKDGPNFEPAAKAQIAVGPVGLGFEYYATLGPVGALLPWRQQEQQVFEVVDLLSVEHLELNAGVGEGLTTDSAGLVFKLIVGWEFEVPPMEGVEDTPKRMNDRL